MATEEIRDRICCGIDQRSLVVEVDLPYGWQPDFFVWTGEALEELARQRRRQGMLRMYDQRRSLDERGRAQGVERGGVRERLDGERIDVARDCTSWSTVVLVRFSKRHRDVAALCGNRRDRFCGARCSKSRLGRPSPRDLVRSALHGLLRHRSEVAGNSREPTDPVVLGVRSRHVPPAGANTDPEYGNVRYTAVGDQRRDGALDVLNLREWILELPGLPSALSERPMVEGECGDPAFCQRPCVDARGLLLDAGQRSSEHCDGAGLDCRRQEEVAHDRHTLDQELVALRLDHCVAPAQHFVGHTTGTFRSSRSGYHLANRFDRWRTSISWISDRLTSTSWSPSTPC